MNKFIKFKVLLTIFSRKRNSKNTFAPITLKGYIIQYVLGFNKSAYWPMHHSSNVVGVDFIKIGIGSAPGLSHGCYIFAWKGAEVFIGDYTIIAPNVCIAGFNHSLTDYTISDINGPLKIGDYCWVGANAVILPNVELGNHTVVAAGAIVTKSFPNGYCVIGGNPAKLIREIPKEECVEHKNEVEYYGYLSKLEFENYQKNTINY